MNIFKLKAEDKDYFEITETIFFDKTQRKHPYKNINSKGQPLYLAVCPDCGNPIEIRNIAAIKDINNRDPAKPFGKHYPYSVLGLASHSTNAYNDCSLRGDVSIGTSKHRTNDALNYQILRLLVDNALTVRRLFSKCIGVLVGETLFKAIVHEFVTRNSFKCQGVRPSNLPFAIAYWAENQSLMFQVVSDADLAAVIKKSAQFDINSKGQVIRRQNATANESLRFYFSGHTHGKEENDEPNTIKLYVKRYKDAGGGEKFYNKTIKYTNNEFFDAIRQEIAKTTEAAIIQREKWNAIARSIVLEHCPEALVEH